MTPTDLLIDLYERVRDGALAAVSELSEDELARRPGPGANSIAWLVWHLARVQDDHVAGVAGHEQVWTRDGWAERLALPLDVADIGYGHTGDQVAVVRAGAEDLAGYLAAVHDRSVAYLLDLDEDDLDRVVDQRWDPPVTLGVRLVSVGDDGSQHVGQAAFVRGLLGR